LFSDAILTTNRGWNGRGEKDEGIWIEVIAVQLLDTFDLSLKPQNER
jgi:hypothetical protein